MTGQGDPFDFEPSSGRTHRRIFRINDKLRQVAREAESVASELEYHRLINDDAQRDAAVGNYIDREEAGLTSGDVRRFERALDTLDRKRERLEAKRDRLMGFPPG